MQKKNDRSEPSPRDGVPTVDVLDVSVRPRVPERVGDVGRIQHGCASDRIRLGGCKLENGTQANTAWSGSLSRSAVSGA